MGARGVPKEKKSAVLDWEPPEGVFRYKMTYRDEGYVIRPKRSYVWLCAEKLHLIWPDLPNTRPAYMCLSWEMPPLEVGMDFVPFGLVDYSGSIYFVGGLPGGVWVKILVCDELWEAWLRLGMPRHVWVEDDEGMSLTVSSVLALTEPVTKIRG